MDRYRQQVGSDLINRAFVGVNGDYFAVGNLAAKLGATQPLKPLKSETIVYKILAMVSMMAQRFNLGTNFDLHLGCLLPPGEFRDRQRIQADLLTALADFDTPVGVFTDGSLIFREGNQIAMKGGYKCRTESSITVKSFVGED